MSNEEQPDTDPMFARPLPEQVTAIRHDLSGMSQSLTLLYAAYERIADRQNLMETQMATVVATPDAMAAVVETVLERRAETNRQERARERAELVKTLRRWGVAAIVGMSTIVPIADKLGHWVGAW